MKVIIFLLSMLILTMPAAAEDWNMFKKDISHSGFTTDTVVPPLTLQWASSLGFETDSSPVIVNDILYIGSNYGVHAIDTKSGREIWRTHTNGFVKAVPAVVEGVLYIGAEDKRFYAIDIKDGSVKWVYKNATDGYTASAAVVNNLAYVGSKDGSFYAFDIKTGEPAGATLTGKMMESSPAIGDGIITFGTDGGVVFALDQTTGKEKWHYNIGLSDIKSSPAIADGTVFIGSNDGRIYALTTAKGALKWTYSTGSNVESSPSIKSGTLFAGSRDTNFYAIDPVTGKLKWQFQAGSFVDSSPAISNDIVYVGSRNNFIYAFDANNGKLLWKNSTGTKEKDYITSPAISGNMLYAATHSGIVYAYSSGEVARATPTPVETTPAPTPALSPTVTPTVTPTATPETPGFEYAGLILLVAVLIKRRF